MTENTFRIPVSFLTTCTSAAKAVWSIRPSAGNEDKMISTTNSRAISLRIAVLIAFVAGAIGASPVQPVHADTGRSLPTAGKPVYLSLLENQTVGGIATARQDILLFNGATWSVYFDGSDVGLGKVNLVAFSLPDPYTILFSIDKNITVNGLAVTPQDIIKFSAAALGVNTSGSFSMYFDGSDTGLDTNA